MPHPAPELADPISAPVNLFRYSKSRRALWLSSIALALLVLIAYSPVRKNAFIWDDDSYIEQDINLRSLGGLGRIWRNDQIMVQYYPLTLTTFWAEYHLWGAHPEPFHIDNVLLQALSAILLWRLLTMLEFPGAWGAAAIWAIHPINVESVAWAAERKNILSGVFYFAAAILYLRSENRDGKPSSSRRTGHYLLALLFFALAMLSKTTAATFPAAVLLVIWWKHGRIRGRDIVKMFPFFLLAAAGGFLTAWIERIDIGATGQTFRISFPEHLLIAGRALWFYLGKLFWPHPLVFIYPRWTLPMPSWMWIYPIGAGAAIALLLVLHRRIGRGPATAALFFAGTLFPALGFINLYPMNFSFVADHFQYMADIGPIAGVVGLIAGYLHDRWRWMRASLAAAVICACFALTWQQIAIYHNIVTLWGNVVLHNPESSMAQFNYGDALRRQGSALATAGRTQQAQERWKLAEEHLTASTKFGPHNAGPWIELGILDEERGQYAAAAQQYHQALLADPTSSVAEMNLGRLDERAGNLPAALLHYQQAVNLNPQDENAMDELGLLLEKMGKTDQAIAVLQQAIHISSFVVNSHWYLGQLFARDGNLDQALAQWRDALVIYPDDARVLESMGISLAAAGRFDKAQQAFEHALKIAPQSKSLQHDLELLHQMMSTKSNPTVQPPTAN